ncbi:Hypothetical protein CINCED_3A011261 [Cinara cedri]|nr:Hypothetical protein CINCED_3A011261 [Cinara cedri]
MTSPDTAVRFFRVTMACAVAFAVCSVRLVTAVPEMRQQQEEGGFGSVLWSVLDGCYDSDSAEPMAVCLKSKALTALDRALARPTVAIANGVALTARDSKSLGNRLTERIDRAVLDAARDSNHKSTLLDNMLASRMNEFVSTRAIVLDTLATQEGRSKKKDQKSMFRALMMVGMMAVAVLGPMAFGFVALLAAKALLIGKIALVLSGIISLKHFYQPQKTVPQTHHYDRRIELMANNGAYQLGPS